MIRHVPRIRRPRKDRKPRRARARRKDEVRCPDCEQKRRVHDDVVKMTPETQAVILGVLRVNGNLTIAAERAGVSRQAIYNLMAADPTFRAAVDNARDLPVDMAEMKLYENVLHAHEPAVEFMLETRGKERGYVRRQEIDATHRNVEWQAEIQDDDTIRHKEAVH